MRTYDLCGPISSRAVLIEFDPPEVVSEGGVVLQSGLTVRKPIEVWIDGERREDPEDLIVQKYEPKNQDATVVAVGRDVWEVGVGDRVLFYPYSYDTYDTEDGRIFAIHIDNCLAVVTPDPYPGELLPPPPADMLDCRHGDTESGRVRGALFRIERRLDYLSRDFE